MGADVSSVAAWGQQIALLGVVRVTGARLFGKKTSSGLGIGRFEVGRTKTARLAVEVFSEARTEQKGPGHGTDAVEQHQGEQIPCQL